MIDAHISTVEVEFSVWSLRRLYNEYEASSSRVKRMGIQQHTAVADKFSAGDGQSMFVMEEDRNSEL
jgi:transcriptional regulator of aromatic amino acid metabolism